MKWKNLACIIAFLAVISPSYALPQEPTEEWVRRYGDKYSDFYGNFDYGYAASVAADSSGNVYVAGFNLKSNPDEMGNMYAAYGYTVTIKYDTNGNVLWVRKYEGGNRNIIIIVDSSDNVYLNGEYATIKYDSSGNLLWDRKYPAGKGGLMAIDSNSNVYVTGIYLGEYNYENASTIKYDSNGNELWIKEYPVMQYLWPSMGIALDSNDNAYVMVPTYSMSSCCTSVMVKYDTNGNELWIKEHALSAYEYETFAPYVMAIDSKDNAYMTGWGYSQESGGYVLTVKYDTSGNELWAKKYSAMEGGWGNNGANAIAIDSKDNIYITQGSEGYNTTNIDIIKYDSNGNELWARQYENAYTDCDPSYNVLKLDSSGNVYVAARTYDRSLGWDYSDYVTMKYDADGNRLWLKTYDSGATDTPHWLTLDSANNIYVTGRSCAFGGSATCEYTTIKYSQPRTIASVISAVEGMFSSGEISNKGLADMLIFQLGNAQSSIERSNTIAAKNMLKALINALEAQSGKNVSADAAQELTGYLNNIIAGL